jgi:hypothetical protein
MNEIIKSLIKIDIFEFIENMNIQYIYQRRGLL